MEFTAHNYNYNTYIHKGTRKLKLPNVCYQAFKSYQCLCFSVERPSFRIKYQYVFIHVFRYNSRCEFT